jgi:hypothetical protein
MKTGEPLNPSRCNRESSLPVETVLLTLFAAIVCLVSYLAAGTIYDFHYKLKADGNPLSKVVTGDRKKLDDKEEWVKRYRFKVLILLALVVAVLIIGFFVV